ncbi:MAG: HEPN domain-containing protein [Methanobacteriota archaeon]
MRTRHVDKSLFRNYLKKAGESLDSAKECLEKGRWNSAVINAVHCGISACDALTVFKIGVRHAGERHEDAITLLESLELPKDVLSSKGRQLSRLLGIKNAAEYEERLMDESEAREAVRDAERFFRWVEELLSA